MPRVWEGLCAECRAPHSQEMALVAEVLQMSHVWEDHQPQLLPDQAPGDPLRAETIEMPALQEELHPELDPH